MADYAIGDVQGCYDALVRLLEHIHFDERQDRLWFCGDLVNRGPKSLETLRFIKALPVTPVITLGNHDLHLLARMFTTNKRFREPDETLQPILTAPDGEELAHWLRRQSILYHHPSLNVVMTHAGIAPMWDLSKAKSLARELEDVLKGDLFRDFLLNMYGNEPNHWSDALTGMTRLRVICNYFTRMRLCDVKGGLDMHYKGSLANAPKTLYPWYTVPNRREIPCDVLFGHWAALEGNCPHPRIHALDTGCLWGGALTAMRLQDHARFSVPCARAQTINTQS